MEKINIAIIGFGTVGSGLYSLLDRNSALIKTRTGVSITIKTICDLRTDLVKEKTKNVSITDSWKEIIDDDDINIVVELIGGIEPAKTIILEALKNNKGVVTANKKLLAEEGMDIFEQAGKNKKLGFEAAVGGGIPCILALKHGLTGNKIKSIMGILNGTTNYILTMMEEKNMSYEESLKDAQDKGFAEADPTSDVMGYDAAHKIALLAMIAYGKKVDYSSIIINGITDLNMTDLSYAHDMGYVIKLMGIAKEYNDGLDIRVHPTMIPLTHPLAPVRNEFNAVMFDADMTDPIILYGKGAGSLPTASAVLSDILQIAERGSLEDHPFITGGDASYIKPENRISRYYLRITSLDQPGILSKISGVLGSHDISIASVIQKETESNEEHVPLIIMTHNACDKDILHAVSEINDFSFVKGHVVIIRVEDSLQEGDMR